MSKKPFNKSGASEVDMERRKFLKSSGAAIASGLAVPLMAASDSVAAGEEGDGNSAAEQRVTQAEVLNDIWNKPNIIILITDQERFAMHWPSGWADANLPNRRKLARHGLTFMNAFTASSACTPSRATLFTGLYPQETNMEVTHQSGTSAIILAQPTLQPSVPNMATMLASAGYDVQYRGKWHLSKDPTGTQYISSAREMELFGFKGWEPPDSGQGGNAITFGGGTNNWDQWYTDGAVDYLKKADSSKPFALIVSLVNPHDICGFPGLPLGTGWNAVTHSDIPPYKGTNNYGGVDLNASPLNQIGLPENFEQEPYKPTCQAQSIPLWAAGLGPLTSNTDYLNYTRFYAYLHMVVDRQIGQVLDALKSRPNMYQNTIVIRLTDHGEMGLSHGAMRQKHYSGYEEVTHIPLVISNPVLFPKPVKTSALASSVDIMPTLATLCGVRKKKIPTLRGFDLTPIIKNAVRHPDNPTRKVQDGVLFTLDEDVGALQNSTFVQQPFHVRCLRQERWKIVMYFDPNGVAASEYELYDLQNDPLEKNNLGNPSNPSYNASQLAIMQQALQVKMEETKTTPA